MALNDSLYPLFGVARLRAQHGQRWAELVDYVSRLEAVDPHVMAFTLTVRRVRRGAGILAAACSDPFCAMCAADVLEMFRGSEEDLLRLYYRHLDEVRLGVGSLRQRRVAEPAPMFGVPAAAVDRVA